MAAQSLGNVESHTPNEMRCFSASNLTSLWLRVYRCGLLSCAIWRGAVNRVRPGSSGGGHGSGSNMDCSAGYPELLLRPDQSAARTADG
jgi:hypothetical protein